MTVSQLAIIQMYQVREESQDASGRLDSLESRLDKLEGFPYAKKLMNLDSYLKSVGL